MNNVSSTTINHLGHVNAEGIQYSTIPSGESQRDVPLDEHIEQGTGNAEAAHSQGGQQLHARIDELNRQWGVTMRLLRPSNLSQILPCGDHTAKQELVRHVKDPAAVEEFARTKCKHYTLVAIFGCLLIALTCFVESHLAGKMLAWAVPIPGIPWGIYSAISAGAILGTADLLKPLMCKLTHHS